MDHLTIIFYPCNAKTTKLFNSLIINYRLVDAARPWPKAKRLLTSFSTFPGEFDQGFAGQSVILPDRRDHCAKSEQLEKARFDAGHVEQRLQRFGTQPSRSS